MKKTMLIAAVAAVALITAGIAFAQAGGGWGSGAGCVYGAGSSGATGTVNIENLKKFQKETLTLRDEMITKRAEIANEYAKQTPDTARITDLRKQMIDIQAAIQKAAEKNGLPAWGHGYGRGHMGRGMMGGRGAGACSWCQ